MIITEENLAQAGVRHKSHSRQVALQVAFFHMEASL